MRCALPPLPCTAPRTDTHRDAHPQDSDSCHESCDEDEDAAAAAEEEQDDNLESCDELGYVTGEGAGKYSPSSDDSSDEDQPLKPQKKKKSSKDEVTPKPQEFLHD